MSILEVRNLVKRFGGLVAVNEVDFAIDEGRITSLIGPNGAGKTTTINLITGFLPVTSGRVVFEGGDITSQPAHRITRMGLVRTFQITQILNTFTVKENIMMGANAWQTPGVLQGMFRMPRERKQQVLADDAAEETMDFLGLKEKRDIVCGHLPYGEKRIVELGRALACRPKLLLLDEPAAGLNTAERQNLIRVINRIRRKGQTILLVEHDMKMVMGISDYVVVINFGLKLAEGTPREVQNNPKVIESYLG